MHLVRNSMFGFVYAAIGLAAAIAPEAQLAMQQDPKNEDAVWVTVMTHPVAPLAQQTTPSSVLPQAPPSSPPAPTQSGVVASIPNPQQQPAAACQPVTATVTAPAGASTEPAYLQGFNNGYSEGAARCSNQAPGQAAPVDYMPSVRWAYSIGYNDGAHGRAFNIPTYPEVTPVPLAPQYTMRPYAPPPPPPPPAAPRYETVSYYVPYGSNANYYGGQEYQPYKDVREN